MKKDYNVMVEVDGETKVIAIEWERKRRKTLVLRVYPQSGRVLFSIPLATPKSYAEQFLLERQDWLKNQLIKILPRVKRYELVTGEQVYYCGRLFALRVSAGKCNEVYIEQDTIVLILKKPDCLVQRRQLLDSFFAQQAGVVLTASLVRMAAAFKFCYSFEELPQLKFRKMSSKWGVCRPQRGEISLNKSLIHLPLPLVDYVLAHELCHFKELNHSKDFWQLVAQGMPDWQKRRAMLNKVGMYMTNY